MIKLTVVRKERPFNSTIVDLRMWEDPNCRAKAEKEVPMPLQEEQLLATSLVNHYPPWPESAIGRLPIKELAKMMMIFLALCLSFVRGMTRVSVVDES